MSPLLTAHTIYAFRKELSFVVLAFLIVLSLPVIAVIILTNTGINIVSDALIGVDTQTDTVVIKNPADGSVVSEVSKEMTWPVQGVTTLRFGQSSKYQLFHTGIDIANPQGQVGDQITTFMEGEVIYAGEIFWGYGKHIIIDHGDNLTSVYAHLNRIYVYEGQKIKIGDIIGTMGTTGWSTGPHLHFEVRVFGVPVDPENFFSIER